MSNKVHYKITGVDNRGNGQSEDCFNNQAACGYADVTVTKNKKDVDCKRCKKYVDNLNDPMEYTRVARGKVLSLHLRDDFIGIKQSSDYDVTLLFANDECTVDKFGRVIWIN